MQILKPDLKKFFRCVLTLGAMLATQYAAAAAVPTNHPPVLRRNVAINASPNEVVTITSTNLFTDDVETVDPVEIVYVVAPGETDPNYMAGSLLLRNAAIPLGGTFTQADVDQRRLTYRAPSQIDFPADSFRFSVRDADGALAADRTFTNFTFRILFSNAPPVAVNGQGSAPLGGLMKGQFAAQNAEKLQAMTFRVVDQGKLGFVTNLNSFTGEFSYQVITPGVPGVDQIKFQVNDGTADALVPGVFTVVIENQRPALNSQTYTGLVNQAISGRLSVSDPDLPAQRMTFRIAQPPFKGRLVLDERTGGFVYTPEAGRFGFDSFAAAVSDGGLESPQASFSILVIAPPQDGDLLLAAQKGTNSGGIYIVNPANGDLSPLYDEKFLTDISSIEYDPIRREVFAAVNASQGKGFVAALGVGKSSLRLVAGMGDGKVRSPLGVAFDANGQLLVADGPGGAVRLNIDTGDLIERFEGPYTKAVIGIGSDAANNVIILDAVNFLSDDSRIVRINAADKSQVVLTSDSRILDPAGVLLRPDGHYLICGRGGLFDLSPADGKVTSLIGPTNTLVTFLKEMTLDDDGFLYIGDLNSGLLRVNLATLELVRIPLDLPLDPLGLASYTVPTNLIDWRRAYFTAAELADPAKEATVWGDKADPDHDGVPNLFEYATGTNPEEPGDGRGGMVATIANTNGSAYFRVSFLYRRGDASLLYTPESSPDLKTWTGGTGVFSVLKDETVGPSLRRVTYEFKAPVAGAKAMFFRLKIEKRPIQ